MKKLILIWLLLCTPVWATSQILVSGDSDATLSTTLGDGFVVMGAHGCSSSTTNDRVDLVVPAAGTIKNLYINLSAAPGGGETRTFTINHADDSAGAFSSSGITCTVATGDTTCSDTVNTKAVTAGERINLQATVSGTVTAATMNFSLEFDSTTDNYTFLASSSCTNTEGAGTKYPSPGGSRDNWSSIQNSARFVIPTDGTFRDIYAFRGAGGALGAGNTVTYSLDVNGTPSSLACTIDGDGTPNYKCSNTSDTASVVAGDIITFTRAVAVSAANDRGLKVSAVFVPDTAGEFLIGYSTSTNSSAASTEYVGMTGGAVAPDATEANEYNLGQSMTIKKMQVFANGAPGAGTSYLLTLRNGVADSALAVTLSDSETSDSTTTNVTVANGALLDTSTVPSGTPTAVNLFVSYVATVSAGDGAGGGGASEPRRRFIILSKNDLLDNDYFISRDKLRPFSD